ncbi:YcxB-like protein [Rubritalea squalenifaciens DSM 18772]|uniref:YcxB-like protein n=1 Tax=Rubritalea squalenifaciens DSM 18772 TaxID=1123071 RepID=A0A1M6BR79_9BACT|nr:YcxB family protein [Rubritalea squalenifaciens]SHI51239.1 YcxB-like protein [Rubritalea squalenifaciens DSM 18772]
MDTPETITLEYEATQTLVNKSASRFVWRKAGPWLIIFALVALGCLSALIMGGRDWYLFVGLIVPAYYIFGWSRYYYLADTNFAVMTDRQVTIQLTEEHLTFHTSQHQSTIKWELITGVWKFRDVWLLFTYDMDHYTMIPTTILNNETIQFIESKIK